MPVPGSGDEKSLQRISFEARGYFSTPALKYNSSIDEVNSSQVIYFGTDIDPFEPVSLTDLSTEHLPTSPNSDKLPPHSMDEMAGYDNGKIICSYMNETYNMPPTMNKIWLAHSRKMKSPDIYMKGYHAIFRPLIKYGKSSRLFSNLVRKCIEDLAINRTYDIIAQYKNTSRWNRGRLYRIIFEPICFIVGKYIQVKERYNGIK